MIWVLEAALALIVAALAGLAWRRGAVRNAVTLGASLLAWLAASVSGYATASLLGALGCRTSTAVFAALTAGLATYAAGVLWLRRRVTRGEPSALERWESAWEAHPRLRAGVAVATGLTSLALAFVVAFVGVNLAALRWPGFAQGGVLLEPLQLSEGPGDAAVVDSPNLLEQAAQRIGLRAGLDAYQSLRVLLTLPSDRMRWLVARDPQLEQVMTHPLLLQLAEDSSFTDQLLNASEGSLSAVAELLDSARFDALRGDVDLRRSLAQIDLARLQERVEHQEARGFPLPLCWREHPLGVLSPGRLESWPTYRVGPLVSLSPRADALRVSSSWTSKQGGPLQLKLRYPAADCRVEGWLNGTRLTLLRRGDWCTASWEAKPGTRQRLQLVLDPGSSPEGRSEPWALEVIPEPPPRVSRAQPSE